MQTAKPWRHDKAHKGRGPDRDHSPAAIWRAMVEAKGMISIAARKLGCSPMTVYRTLDRYPDMRTDLAELRSIVKPAIIEKATSNILSAVDRGDERWSAWLLERWDKTNFSTRTEHTGPDGGPIEHMIAEGEITQVQMTLLTDDQLRTLIEAGRIADELESQSRPPSPAESGMGAPQAGV
jgi:hypothetical protein